MPSCVHCNRPASRLVGGLILCNWPACRDIKAELVPCLFDMTEAEREAGREDREAINKRLFPRYFVRRKDQR